MIYIYLISITINNFSSRSLSELPKINLTEKESIEIFTPYSIYGGNYNWFIKDEKHKLLYCFIPKNICTIFKQILYFMINDNNDLIYKNNNNYNWIHNEIDYHSKKYKPKPNSIYKLLNNWKSFVILRDPLERLLSGYLDKCINSNKKWCENLSDNDRYNFTKFVNIIIQKINKNKLMDIHDHYRPQHTFCGMNKYFNYFNYKILYNNNKQSISNQTLKFMKYANIDINKYYYKWGKYKNQSIFDKKTSHSTNKIINNLSENNIKFYSKFFDYHLAIKTIVAFDKDYKMLNIPYPKWVQYLPKK